MGEPKMVRGQYGWAAIGDGVMVYARTRAEALRRFRAAFAGQTPPERIDDVRLEDVVDSFTNQVKD